MKEFILNIPSKNVDLVYPLYKYVVLSTSFLHVFVTEELLYLLTFYTYENFSISFPSQHFAILIL